MQGGWGEERIVKFITGLSVFIKYIEMLGFAKLISIGIYRTQGLSIKLCIFAVFIHVIAETFADMDLSSPKPLVLIRTTEITHQIIEMVMAVAAGRFKMWHSQECWRHFGSCAAGTFPEPGTVGEAVSFFRHSVRAYKQNSVRNNIKWTGVSLGLNCKISSLGSHQQYTD